MSIKLYDKSMTKDYSTAMKEPSLGPRASPVDDTNGTLKTGDVDIDNLYPIAGAVCCIINFFPTWPGNISLLSILS